MKTVKTKKRVFNPVTGRYYPIYKRVPEEGDKPIKGLWGNVKEARGKEKKK